MDELNGFNYFQAMPFRIALLSLHTVLLSRDSLASLRWKVISVTKSQSNGVLIKWSAHKLLPPRAPPDTNAAAQGCIACCLGDAGTPDPLLGNDTTVPPRTASPRSSVCPSGAGLDRKAQEQWKVMVCWHNSSTAEGKMRLGKCSTSWELFYFPTTTSEE